MSSLPNIQTYSSNQRKSGCFNCEAIVFISFRLLIQNKHKAINFICQEQIKSLTGIVQASRSNDASSFNIIQKLDCSAKRTPSLLIYYQDIDNDDNELDSHRK